MNITGTLVVDLIDLDTYDRTNEARHRLAVIEHVPPGARVIIRVGRSVPTLVDFGGVKIGHVDIEIEAAEVDLIKSWLSHLRAAA
jgi:hypothetical protein